MVILKDWGLIGGSVVATEPYGKNRCPSVNGGRQEPELLVPWNALDVPLHRDPRLSFCVQTLSKTFSWISSGIDATYQQQAPLAPHRALDAGCSAGQGLAWSADTSRSQRSNWRISVVVCASGRNELRQLREENSNFRLLELQNSDVCVHKMPKTTIILLEIKVI